MEVVTLLCLSKYLVYFYRFSGLLDLLIFSMRKRHFLESESSLLVFYSEAQERFFGHLAAGKATSFGRKRLACLRCRSCRGVIP
jgi:hypothetical protein